MTEIIKQANAETIKHLVEAKLADFGIFLKNDVIASTNDAAVMKKYGNLLGALNQLCHNHALHLAVMHCFYIPKNYIPDEIFDDIEDSVDDDMEEKVEEDSTEDQYSDCNLDFAKENEFLLKLNTDFNQIITDLRGVIRIFKKSATKHSMLQQNITKMSGKKLKLKLDIKTQWNSLSLMIRRFLILSECINKSLIELNFDPISENDVLALLETAATELSKKDANLITAEGVNKFLFEKLQPIQTSISKKLIHAIKKRMDESRDPVLHVFIELLLFIFVNTSFYF